MLMAITDRSGDVCLISLKSPITDQYPEYRPVRQKTKPESSNG